MPAHTNYKHGFISLPLVYVCVQNLQRPEEDAGSPGDGVIDRHELLCGC